jgi:hypothetical protein
LLFGWRDRDPPVGLQPLAASHEYEVAAMAAWLDLSLWKALAPALPSSSRASSRTRVSLVTVGGLRREGGAP